MGFDAPGVEVTTKLEGWRPNSEKQTEVLSRGETEILAGGARGGGKTEITFPWLIEPAYCEHPDYRSLVIRRDYDDLQEWLFRAKRFYGSYATITGNPATIRWPAGGETRIGHWKDKGTISKYLGHEYWKIVLEELTQSIGTLEEYMMLLGSLRCSVPGIRGQVLASSNPGGGGHSWVKRYFVDLATEKCYTDPKTGYTRIYIPFKATDNPSCPPEYINWLNGLPEPLRSAWRDGSWDVYEGQYFGNFGSHLEEEPFDIPPHECERSLYMGLDYGYGLKGVSSAGLWWLDAEDVPHRLKTWHREGMTASEQAADLYDEVVSFPHTSGVVPCEVVYDNNMDNRAGLERDDWCPIDYFKNAFRKHRIKWTPANKKRINGWQVMLDYFSPDVATGEPKLRYWSKYNGTWCETIPLLVHDDNKPEDVMKCAIDHEADETRYLLVRLRNLDGASAVENPREKAVRMLLKVRAFERGLVETPAGY